MQHAFPKKAVFPKHNFNGAPNPKPYPVGLSRLEVALGSMLSCRAWSFRFRVEGLVGSGVWDLGCRVTQWLELFGPTRIWG